MVSHLLHSPDEITRGFVKLVLREFPVQQLADMRDDRLVEVDIAKLLHKPLRTVRAVAYPATEALGRGPGGDMEESFVVIGLCS